MGYVEKVGRFVCSTKCSKQGSLKKLMDLGMKEGTTMSVHLNESNSIIKRLANTKLNIDDEFKATSLLCTLPKSLLYPRSQVLHWVVHY